MILPGRSVEMRYNAIILLLVVGAFHLMCPQWSIAQQQRDTGRHKPKPVINKEVTTVVEVGTLKPGSLHLGVQVGFTKGSGLFDASTQSGNPVPWGTIGGGSFNSPRFSTKFHNNLVAGLLF